MNDNIPITEFDSLVCSKELNILKALLPFVSPDGQRFLSVFIKFQELMNTMKLVNSISSRNKGICKSHPKGESSALDIIDAVKIYLNKEEASKIENYINMFNAIKMFNELSSLFGNEDSSDSEGGSKDSGSNNMFNMDMLKNMLSPEQQAIFESLQNMEV